MKREDLLTRFEVTEITERIETRRKFWGHLLREEERDGGSLLEEVKEEARKGGGMGLTIRRDFEDMGMEWEEMEATVGDYGICL